MISAIISNLWGSASIPEEEDTQETMKVWRQIAKRLGLGYTIPSSHCLAATKTYKIFEMGAGSQRIFSANQMISFRSLSLDTLPVYLTQLNKLPTLCLSDNRFKTLPVFITSLHNLRELYISWEPIHQPVGSHSTMHKYPKPGS